jgi:hypothetical protein
MFKRIMPIVFVVLVACQPVTVQHHETGPVPVSLRVDDAAYWLEEWSRATALPEDQLQQTLASREQDFERLPDVRSRLRLALLLAFGPAPVRDQARALELVENMHRDAASGSALALADLIAQSIAEQRWTVERISELRTELEASAARIGELEQQLQALTSIEQSIKQRETPTDLKEIP